jgi:hypothetical protein
MNIMKFTSNLWHCFLLTLVIVFSASPLFAQNAPPPEVTYDDDPCKVPVMISNAQVRYKHFASFYIKLVPVTWTSEHGIWIDAKDNSFHQYYTTTNDELFVAKLPLDKEYIVSAWTSCGEHGDILSLSTSQNKEEFVNVSNDMFNVLGDWTRNPKNLYDFIEAAEGIHWMEKTAFMQDYFMNGQAIDDIDMGKIPPKPKVKLVAQDIDPVVGIDDPNCNCKMIMQTTQAPYPRGSISSTGLFSPLVNNPDEYYWSAWNGFYVSWEKFQEYSTTVGPARKLELTASGRKYHDRGRHWATVNPDHNDENSTISPNFAALRYNYLCSDRTQQMPSSCSCDKNLHLSYRYDTDIQASANLRECDFCGSRWSFADAEDVATIIMWDENTTRATTLGAGKARASSQCNHTLNPDFFTQLGKVALTAGQVYLATQTNSSGGTGGTDVATAISGQSTTIVSQLTTLMQTPIHNSSNCEDAHTSSTLLYEPSKLISLPPNKPKTILMSTNSSLNVGGATGWDGRASIGSDFYMAAVIAPYIDDESTRCCSKNITNWVAGSQGSAPHSLANVKEGIGSFLGIWGPWNPATMPRNQFTGEIMIPSDANSVTGLANERCSAVLNPRLAPKNLGVEIYQDKLTGNAYLYQLGAPKEFSYEIIDVTGR